MPGRSSRRQDPFARINNWDDGFEHAQPAMSGGRGPQPERHGSRRHADDHRPRRRDPSPLSDYDPPRRRNYRDESPPPYRSVESHTPPHRGRYDDEPIRRRRSTREVPHSRGYADRSPSPPRRRYRSPSPAERRRRSPDRYYERPASPPRHRAPPQPERPGLSRSKTTTGIGLSPRWQQAATAALQAGSLAALTMRSEPGPWTGPKGMKVATAALGAGFMKATGKGDDKKQSISGGGHGGGASRGVGGSSGGMKTKGVEMLAGFVASQLAKKASQKTGARY